MPRNGAGVYSHPFPNVVEGTTIESAVFNGNTSDVEQDLNTPRPIVAGGTGANNAHDAMIALSGEIAVQQVTNYDSFPFAAGSFWSATGATSAPRSDQPFAGICYYHGADPGYMTIEARSEADSTVPGRLYVRQKIAGSWGIWSEQPGSLANLDAAYVNVAGDTMTGALTVNGGSISISGTPTPVLVMAPSTGSTAYLQAYQNANNYVVSGIGAAGIGNFSLSDMSTGLHYHYRDIAIGGTTASTSPTTGALTVAGGVGVGASLNVAGEVKGGTGVYATGQLSGLYPTSMVMDVSAGNCRLMAFGPSNGVEGTMSMMTLSANASLIHTVWTANSVNMNIPLPTASSSPTTGALTVAGGVGIGGALFTGGGIGATGGITSTTVLVSAPGDTPLAAAIGGPVGTARIQMWGDLGAGTGAKILFNTGNGAWIDTAIGGPIRFAHNGTPTVTFGTDGKVTSLSSIQAGYNVIANNGGLVMNAAATVYFLFNSTDNTMAYRWNNVTKSYWTGDGNFIHVGQAYKPGGGAWADSSDARIKNVEGEYTRGLAEIAALRPVYYTFKGNDTNGPPSHPTDVNGELLDAELKNTPAAVPYPNSAHHAAAENATKYAGLIAQEVEAIIPEMITKRSAYIDGQPVDDLRDLDTTPLIFALVNAVKELTTRLEALEGGAARRR